MTEFEYTNDLYDKEVDLIIKFINKELAFLRKNKKNITRYLYLENIKGKILFLDFQRMVEEIQRMVRGL